MATKVTDTIPRASISQVLGVLRFLLDRGGKATFEDVRVLLLAASRRRSPNTATAMWTVARDALTELEKLNLARVGVLPRKLSDVDRLRDAPCQLLPDGARLAELHATNLGEAYDAVLLSWLAEHPYFRALMLRLQRSPLHVPDVTSLAQLGHEDVKAKRESTVLANLLRDCTARLERVGWSPRKINRFRAGAERRVTALEHVFSASEFDAKWLVDVAQDGIVLPAFLEAEELAFDAVTFQQLLKSGHEFLATAWTASHPDFSGRVIFPVCQFHPSLPDNPHEQVTSVTHHGISYAEPRFAPALREAYIAVAGAGAAGSGYVSAYTIRAIVCVELRIPQAVFAKCLEALIAAGPRADLTAYTELPFEPPPQGEEYVEVGRRRIGRLKLTTNSETTDGDQILS
jgi:hypothetical protein